MIGKSTVQAVIFIGIQGSGKSTFYERSFASTHLRISRDIAGTAAREKRLLEQCISQKIDFAVDNTNATRRSREPFICAAKRAGYRVVGYYFIADVKECIARNAQRTGKAKVPVAALYRARKIMTIPTFDEGFDSLFSVRVLGTEVDVQEIKPPGPPG